MKNFKASSEHDLYNRDLKPLDDSEKQVKPLGYGVIWFGIALQLGAFVSYSPLVYQLTIGQFMIAILLGSAILISLSFIAKDIGIKHGLSFAVSVSAAFGYRGGQIVNFIRLIPAIFFTTINTYIGAAALNEIFKIVFGVDMFALSFAVNVALLILVTVKKMKGIELFMKIITPLLVIVGIYLFWEVLHTYNISFFEMFSMGNIQGENPSIGTYIMATSVIVGAYVNVALGMNDLSKDNKNYSDSNKWFQANKRYIFPMIIAVVPAFLFNSLLGSLVIVATGADGADIISAISVMVTERSIALGILLNVFIIVAQVSTSVAANMLPGAYALSSFFPKKVSYTSGLYIFALAVIVFIPLTLGDQIQTIIALFSATLAPALAIIGVDYYIFRKRNIDIDALFNSRGKYRYSKGINIVAAAVFIITTLIGFLFFQDLSLYFTAPVAAVLYYIGGKIFNKKYPYMVESDSGYKETNPVPINKEHSS
ncbi:cytosine permease [Bacillus sp. 37MA]|uniref:cytosine permease n=1 Tax=Bacillus sp. 37MA TaxID=1132442 RepID=UPI00036DDE41|nr:cytosine permease [Bacillus sp. 37MA]